MEHLDDLADDRLIQGCLYCDGAPDTREHVPSRIFLDTPFPPELPIVGACNECNNGFSMDETYVACLVEAVVAGTTEPGKMRRPTIAKILRRSKKLRARLDAARQENGGQTSFMPEVERVRKVMVKLARGHAAFELSQLCRDEPTHVDWAPIALMSVEEREEFEDAYFPHLFPEIGSRATQRMMVISANLTGPDGKAALPAIVMQDWQDVQEDRYSYLATDDGEEVRVRIIIGGYLACDVRWNRRPNAVL